MFKLSEPAKLYEKLPTQINLARNLIFRDNFRKGQRQEIFILLKKSVFVRGWSRRECR